MAQGRLCAVCDSLLFCLCSLPFLCTLLFGLHMSAHLPHDPDVVSCPESVNSASLLVRNAAITQSSTGYGDGSLLQFGIVLNFSYSVCFRSCYCFRLSYYVCYRLCDNEKLADGNRSSAWEFPWLVNCGKRDVMFLSEQ